MVDETQRRIRGRVAADAIGCVALRLTRIGPNARALPETQVVCVALRLTRLAALLRGSLGLVPRCEKRTLNSNLEFACLGRPTSRALTEIYG